MADAISTEMGAPKKLAVNAQAPIGLNHIQEFIRAIKEFQFEHPFRGCGVAGSARGDRNARDAGRHPQVTGGKVLAGQFQCSAPELRCFRMVARPLASGRGLLNLLPDDVRVRPPRAFEKARVVDRCRDGFGAALRFASQ